MNHNHVIIAGMGTLLLALEHIFSLFQNYLRENNIWNFCARLLLCLFAYILIFWSYYILLKEKKEKKKEKKETIHQKGEESKSLKLDEEKNLPAKYLERLVQENSALEKISQLEKDDPKRKFSISLIKENNKYKKDLDI